MTKHALKSEYVDFIIVSNLRLMAIKKSCLGRIIIYFFTQNTEF